MSIISEIIWILALIYSCILVYFFLGICRVDRNKRSTTSHNSSVSVIVCARNEERYIRACVESLLTQSYPVEIIIVNDRSSDATAEILASFGDAVTVIHITECPAGISPKKNALMKGFDAAKGNVLLLTDADCIVPPDWAASMFSRYSSETGICAGLVYVRESSLWHRLMNLELFALSACTAGAIGMGIPMIATGNNLSYRKKAYEEAGGISPVLHIDSGDDDLMVQRIAALDVWTYAFCTDPDSFVQTEPVGSLAAFIRQRRRWASRGLDYPWWLIIILVCIYGMFLVFLIVPVGLALSAEWLPSLLPIGIALGMEIVVLTAGLLRFKRLRYILYYPIVKLLQVPYILIMPILGIVKGFTWK